MKALKLRDELLTSALCEREKNHLTKFLFSESWITSFVKRSGLKSVVVHGQAGSVDRKAIEKDTKLICKSCEKNLKSFSLDRIYNMDETGLFFRSLPRKSYVYTEDRNTTRGTKSMKAKDRITLIIATNGDGSHLLPLTIIGASENPRESFTLRKCPVPYISQKRAWNDSVTCSQWFSKFFLPAIRKRTSQKVALIMENASSHGYSLEGPNDQVQLFFLPPNCTAVYRPMDCGIIAAVKIKYRYSVLGKTADLLEQSEELQQAFKSSPDGTKGILEGYPPHVLDAAEMIKEVLG